MITATIKFTIAKNRLEDQSNKVNKEKESKDDSANEEVVI